MDRTFVAPGQIPLDTDYLSWQKNAMIAIAALAESAVGLNQGSGSGASYASAYGLAATALGSGVVAGSAFAIQIGRGFIFSYQEVDPNAYGNLGADTARNILKTGINLSPINLGITNAATATPGYSTNYLVSAAFQEADTGSTAVPFVNASNPASPLVETLNTVRAETVVFQVSAGAAAATGTQATPSTPAGYVPLWVVTINNGDTATVSGQIATAPGAPFMGAGASQRPAPGYWARSVAGTYSWTPPAGCYTYKAEVIGAGGPGAAGNTTGYRGPGGGGGGRALGAQSCTPGVPITVVVGAGGAAPTSATVTGGNGGTSSVGAISASGGTAGVYSSAAGGLGGIGSGGAFNTTLGDGSDGSGGSAGGGSGDGGGPGSRGGAGVALVAHGAGGGSGGTSYTIQAQAGADGAVIIEY